MINTLLKCFKWVIALKPHNVDLYYDYCLRFTVWCGPLLIEGSPQRSPPCPPALADAAPLSTISPHNDCLCLSQHPPACCFPGLRPNSSHKSVNAMRAGPSSPCLFSWTCPAQYCVLSKYLLTNCRGLLWTFSAWQFCRSLNEPLCVFSWSKFWISWSSD